MFLPSILPAGNLVKVFLRSSLGNGGLGIAILAMLVAIQVKGEPIMNIQKLAKDFQWNIMFLLAFFLSQVNLMTNDATGIKPAINQIVGPLVSGMPPTMVVLVLCLIASILTNFLNNNTVGVFMISTAVIMSDSLGDISMFAVSICILISCFVAVATPAATAMAAIIFGQKDMITYGNQTISGLVAVVSLWLIIAVICFPYLSWVL